MRPLTRLYDGERYFLIPQVLVLAGLIQVAAESRRWMRWSALGLLGGALTRYRVPALPESDWATWAARIERGEEVKAVPIAPKGLTFYYPGNPERRNSQKE
ncbi:MAG: hypothetical protein J6386_18250 [Candidatus Synoicihabitans palmerolidicus]|nr:hypothetical protein [Candidatus Synoicihabitans palmerolidicus]